MIRLILQRNWLGENGLDVVEIFFESKSAKEPGGKVFNEMLEFIENQKEIGIITWKLDRLTRNPLDSGKIQWLSQTGIIKEIRTSDRTYYPEDNALIYAVESGMANQYSRDLSKNVLRGIQSKLEKGIWPNRAPMGYSNKNNQIVIDKENSKYLKRAFELYSRGDCSLREVANILFAEGFRSRAGYKYHKSKLYKIFSNPFYYGVMFMHGEYYSGIHEPIISKTLFDKVQLAMNGRSHSKKQKHLFAFRGMLHCEKCGCLLTATKKKGFTYYYCTNGRGECEEHKKYLRSEKVEAMLADSLGKLNLSAESVEIMYLSVKEAISHKRNYKEELLNTPSKELNLVKTKRERLLDLYCVHQPFPQRSTNKKKVFLKKKKLI